MARSANYTKSSAYMTKGQQRRIERSEKSTPDKHERVVNQVAWEIAHTSWARPDIDYNKAEKKVHSHPKEKETIKHSAGKKMGLGPRTGLKPVPQPFYEVPKPQD